MSDEWIVEQWIENAYYQYFCGERYFSEKASCNPTELFHFCNRIDESWIELILQAIIRVNDDEKSFNRDDVFFIDTTVQENDISYPIDSKLFNRIINKCLSIA